MLMEIFEKKKKKMKHENFSVNLCAFFFVALIYWFENCVQTKEIVLCSVIQNQPHASVEVFKLIASIDSLLHNHFEIMSFWPPKIYRDFRITGKQDPHIIPENMKTSQNKKNSIVIITRFRFEFIHKVWSCINHMVVCWQIFFLETFFETSVFNVAPRLEL